MPSYGWPPTCLVKHGAFIDKYIGDAVMALFNVPIRYEDHARRAILAATELGSALQDLGARFGLSLDVSVGIATGYARVGRLGSEDSKDYTAIGDVVNLAARLQGKAGAGEILIAKQVTPSIRPQFPEAATGVAPAKGISRTGDGLSVTWQGRHPSGRRRSATPVRERTSLGAIIFGILGAPCAVSTLIGPLAVAVGASGLFGLAGALVFLDQSVIRLPILVLASLAAVANLYTLWHARKLRTARKSRPTPVSHDDFGKTAESFLARGVSSHLRNLISGKR